MSHFLKSAGGHPMPRRKLIKLASLPGSGIAADNLLSGLTPLARSAARVWGMDSGLSGGYFPFGDCAMRVTLPLARLSAVAVAVIVPESAVLS